MNVRLFRDNPFRWRVERCDNVMDGFEEWRYKGDIIKRGEAKYSVVHREYTENGSHMEEWLAPSPTLEEAVKALLMIRDTYE